MKTLAELVMRGRLYAASLAFICTGLPLLSWLAAAIVVLVTLRKGGAEGALILLVALIQAGLIGETAEIATASAIVAVYFSACVLRSTVNLAYGLLSLVLAALMLLIGIIGQAEGVLDTVKQVLESQLIQMRVGDAAGMNREDFIHLMAVQSISYGVGFTALAGLLVGRWWQAMLFNPGGFQREFHALRLSPFITISLLMLSIVGYSGAEWWGEGRNNVDIGNQPVGSSELGSSVMMLNVAAIASLMTLPISITGAAIVHSIVKTKQASAFWLIGFYLTLPVTNTMLYLMVLVDGFIDIRGKMSQQADV